LRFGPLPGARLFLAPSQILAQRVCQPLVPVGGIRTLSTMIVRGLVHYTMQKNSVGSVKFGASLLGPKSRVRR
jgi:hypothetical protein